MKAIFAALMVLTLAACVTNQPRYSGTGTSSSTYNPITKSTYSTYTYKGSYGSSTTNCFTIGGKTSCTTRAK